MATEKRLIDANRVINKMQKCIDESPDARDSIAVFAFSSIIECLKQEPTVDAVEVVRCKDCTNFERKFPGYGYCYHWDYEPGMSPNEVEEDDFCSYGERRTDNA